MRGIIAAISTPPGKGGVAVIRVSGKGAVALCDKVFLPASGKLFSSYPTRTQVYGYIMNNEERLDDCLACHFGEGSSYTGEETVEISCHGGKLISAEVLRILISAGAAPAQAGEFTRLAFLNGKLTLTEAEAIGDLLDAKTTEQIKLASTTARRGLSEAIEQIKASLTTLLADIYARIDYPDEDLGDLTDGQTLDQLLLIKADVERLANSYKTGKAINEGIDTVICGKPNVGKSTLYNALLCEDAAIVTDVEGTTRDLLERQLSLGRVLIRLTDTAGIRQNSTDKVEMIGIDRTRAKISACDLVIAVFDGSEKLDQRDGEVIDALKGSSAAKICIINKAEKPARIGAKDLPELFDEIILLDAKDRPEEAREKLSASVNRLFTDERIASGTDPIISSARQHGALIHALGLIDSAIESYRIGLPTDAASSDIEMALTAIGEVDGRAVSEDVVNNIFSRFCVGK